MVTVTIAPAGSGSIKGTPDCPEGFVFDKALGKCVPKIGEPKKKSNIDNTETDRLERERKKRIAQTPRPGEVPVTVRDTATGNIISELTAQENADVLARRSGTRESGDSSAFEDRLAQLKGAPTSEDRARDAEVDRIIAEETPQRRELDPILQPGQDTPVVGPLAIKIRNALARTPEGKDLLSRFAPDVGEEFELQPEELRTLALTEIERQVFETGLTESEKFGSLIEAADLVGLSKFNPGEAELPSGNVQTILKSARILKSRAIDVELKYLKGIWSKAVALERLDSIDNELQFGESRMRLLIQNSPELQFNSDGVNFIELKVLEVRERSFDSRISVEKGIPGTPTDIDIILALEGESRAALSADFDIP